MPFLNFISLQLNFDVELLVVCHFLDYLFQLEHSPSHVLFNSILYYHHICVILSLIILLKYQVASAVLDWARDNGASVYTHWFQPLGSSGVRWGLASGVQNTMMEFLPDGTPAWDFKGKHLLNGETDGASYMNGGLRGTHQAGGKY